LQQIAQHAAFLLLRAIREMIDKCRGGEIIKIWYEREVRPLMMQLSNLKVEFTSVESTD